MRSLSAEAHRLAGFLEFQPTHEEHLEAAAVLKKLATVHDAARDLAKAKSSPAGMAAYQKLIKIMEDLNCHA